MASPGNKTKTPRGSVISSCTCISPFQDEKYGKGKRVKNNYAKGVRCTVCGKESDK